MNLLIAKYAMKVWRRVGVPERRNSLLEIMAKDCPYNRADQKVRAKALPATRIKQLEGESLIYSAMINKRTQHMPIQYIVKNWQFRYIRYRAFPPVFIPRF